MAAELFGEIKVKTERIVEFLKAQGHAALWIRRNENLAWLTAGRMNRRVLLPADTNVASIVVTQAGRRFFLTTNNEAVRLADEDFADLGYDAGPDAAFEAVVISWHADGFGDALKKIAGAGTLATDYADGEHAVVSLNGLRTPLLDGEIKRYRQLGREVAGIVATLLQKLTPGMTEHQMNAMVAAALWTEGIEPSVLLMAVDERIRKYKHAVGHGQELLHFGMLNLCARRAGLSISITRFIHFGAMAQELVDAFAAAAHVNAALMAATREGVTASDLFETAKAAYAKAGFPGAEELHHQGGPAGYMERDWVATPGGKEAVVNAQGFAWNPSVRGGKVEDTVLLLNGKIELLTPTPSLPQVKTKAGGKEYVSAGVLLR